MARALPLLNKTLVAEIEAAWVKVHPRWAWRRLLVVRLLAQHNMTVAEITKTAGVSRQTVFTYRTRLNEGGVSGLLQRRKAPGARSVVRGVVEDRMLAWLGAGSPRNTKAAREWIKHETGATLSPSAVRKLLARLRGRIKGSKLTHP